MQDIMAKTPDALANRERIVPLVDGGSIIVRRWNWAREVAALKLVVGLLGKIDLDSLGGKNPFATIAEMVGALGDNILPLVKLSLDGDDSAQWDALSPVDRMEILVAIYEINRLGD
jgi:hypothetical protein